MVHRVSNAEYRKHCSNHYCEFGSNCDEPRAVGVKVCGTHRCRRAGCPKGLQNAAGRYCEDHECKDATGPCLEERVAGSEWCTRHICRDYFENCKNQGDPNKGHFCTDHVRCETTGCANKIFIDKGVRRQFCEDHYYGICDYIGCNKPRKSSNGNKHHCDAHACSAPEQCSGARTMTSMFCAQHKCSDAACDSRRAQSASLSPSVLRQLNATANAGAGAGTVVTNLNIYDPWCATHRCRDPGCAAQAVSPGGLCATHVCRETGCAARATQDNGYCDQHCCRERGCLRAPIDAYHNYCDVHYHSDDDSSDGYDSDVWSSYANGGSAGGALGSGAYGAEEGECPEECAEERESGWWQ
ncbi:hypothetical protein PG997_000373 [Apiospora hydei]|uniref:Uncharacterized protein n=1 Tax=Apiospora hydei TaxID=1337664 RepID=A0ABR1XAR5_9PEZI